MPDFIKKKICPNGDKEFSRWTGRLKAASLRFRIEKATKLQSIVITAYRPTWFSYNSICNEDIDHFPVLLRRFEPISDLMNEVSVPDVQQKVFLWTTKQYGFLGVIVLTILSLNSRVAAKYQSRLDQSTGQPDAGDPSQQVPALVADAATTSLALQPGESRSTTNTRKPSDG
jgi:hypothetical protein